MSSLTQVPTESAGPIARAIEDVRIADETDRVRKLRRLQLRAAVLTIDRLLEELELLNLQGRSRSLSAWHRRLFSLGRLPNASPQHVMNELFELQQRLMRELAGPERDSVVQDEMSAPGHRDASPLRSGS